MRPTSMTQSMPRGLILVSIILLGLNLRPIMAAIGPLLDTMQARIGLSDVSAGLLTTLPVLAMGSIALLGGVLQDRIGTTRAVGFGVAAIALACFLRWPFGTAATLIATAGLGGVGIAIIQALLPGFIKQHMGVDAGRGMALYTTGIMGGAALSSASVSPLSHWIGWQDALAIWAALAVVAGMAWWRTSIRTETITNTAGYRLPLRSRRAWFLMTFFGIGTSAYTLILAWLPPFYTQLGWSATGGGLLLGGLTLTQVVSGLVLSSFINRFPDRRMLLTGILIIICAGLLCLIIAPRPLALLAIGLLGVGVGALFPMSLIVTMDHLDDPGGAGALMGFVQGGGYIMASAMPLIAGLIRQMASALTDAWILMLIGLVVQIAMVPIIAPSDRLEPRNWRLIHRANT